MPTHAPNRKGQSRANWSPSISLLTGKMQGILPDLGEIWPYIATVVA